MLDKVVAIIPARGGAKGIPGKNINLLAGKPLLAYVIEAAHGTRLIEDVFVSTDSEEIKTVALQYRAKVIDRPAEFATDTATSEAVLVHALQYLRNKSQDYKICVFMQATSPLTRSGDLDKLVHEIKKGKDSAGCYVKDYGFFWGLHDASIPHPPRQVREPYKREAGNAWAFTVEGFLKARSRHFGEIGLVEIEEPRQLEIDTLQDFDYIEYLIKTNSSLVNI